MSQIQHTVDGSLLQYIKPRATYFSCKSENDHDCEYLTLTIKANVSHVDLFSVAHTHTHTNTHTHTHTLGNKAMVYLLKISFSLR